MIFTCYPLSKLANRYSDILKFMLCNCIKYPFQDPGSHQPSGNDDLCEDHIDSSPDLPEIDIVRNILHLASFDAQTY